MAAASSVHAHPARSAERRTALDTAVADLEAWGRRRSWSGSDPYDGLNATRWAQPWTKSVLGRRLLTQAVKRSPFNLRPLLGIPAGRSAAALAQVASSYAIGVVPRSQGRVRLAEILEALETERCTGFALPCWGYHFDVQTRVFFYPAGSPNTIATAFAGLALLDAFEATHDSRLLGLATATGDFFLRHIPQTETAHGAFFGYLVGDRTPIHNANTLASALLARLARHTNREDMRSAAEAGLAWTIALQRPDGSWPYGEQPHLQWVDNFHTGYVLDSLIYSQNAGMDVDGGVALDRGLSYYRRSLFLEDGTPMYTPSSVYPIDAQCLAQGIQTMTLAGSRCASYGAWAWRLFDFALHRMQRSDGSYVFQRRRRWTNPAPHIRWMAAPMMQALALLRASPEPEG